MLKVATGISLRPFTIGDVPGKDDDNSLRAYQMTWDMGEYF